MTLAPEHFHRLALRETGGSWVNPRGFRRGGALTADRERLPVENALNSFGDRYADIPGAQIFNAALEWYLHSSWLTDLADVVEAAFGSKDTTANPTFGATPSDNFSANTSGNAASSIVKVTADDGLTYIIPVDVDNGGALTFGIGLPTGVKATDVDNPAGHSGACFDYTLGGAAQTFDLEGDWSNKPTSSTQEVLLASLCALTSLKLLYDRGQPLILHSEWIGGSYTEGGGPGVNTSDTSAWKPAGPSWCGDWLLTKAASPTWSDTKTKVQSLDVELTPPLVVDRGPQGLDGGSTVNSVLPGSDITGYTRDAAWEGDLTIVVPYNKDYLTDFKAQTPFRLFGVLYEGVPGGAAIGAARTALYFRRLVPVGRPKVVIVNGGKYHELKFRVERDRTANSNQERCAFARFN
jgi:hypothetical protein